MNKEINLFEHLETASLEDSCKADEAVQEKAIQSQQIKRIIEALLFSSNEPIPFAKIREITESSFPCKPKVLRDLLQELERDYIVEQRAFRLEEIAQGYIIRTCEEYAPYIHFMQHGRRAEKLSKAATEVLAIIAYKQPITRSHIDAIRGVDSSGSLYNLIERKLIEVTGRLETPGKPSVYATTSKFLSHFGLRDLNDLPPL